MKQSLSSARLALLLSLAVLLTAGTVRVLADFTRATRLEAARDSLLTPLPPPSWASVTGEPAAPAMHRQRLGGTPVTLVERGIPRSVIVVETARDDPTSQLDHTAAELLQEWIELMTGTRLEIAPTPGNRIPIYVGDTAIAAGLRIDDIESRSREGHRVRVESDRVLIAGQSGNARIKAAVTFLEELGCRWYMEGDLGRHYPSTDTLMVQPVELTVKPGFLYRRIWGGDGWARETPWKIWNGAGGLSLSMGHDWHQITEEDFAEHPDWFAMDREGERIRGRWLNTGNPELREAFAERLIARMSPGEHPSISPPDGYRFDHSPASSRYDDPDLIEPSSGNVSMSNRFMHFANDIAARVRAVHPDSILNFYAYSDYSLPPTLIDRLEPNIAIWIAPIRFSRFHRIGSPNSPSRQELQRAIEGWSEVAGMLGYRTYNYNLAESMTPFAKLTTWSHDIPYLANRNFIGMNLESFPTWDLSAPTIYLSIRLAYDPGGDPDAILADFYRVFYGPAADAMRRYWETVDEGWQELETESGSVYSVHLVFTDERMRRLDRALTEAARTVSDDPIHTARVAMARTAYLHARDFLDVREAMHDAEITQAGRIYDTWHARTQASIDAGTGHVYNRRYLQRFVGRYVDAARDALAPARGPERRVMAVLPDVMQLAYESDLRDAGARAEPALSRTVSGRWRTVRTYGATLDQQDLPDRLEVMWYRTEIDARVRRGRRYFLHFTTVDGTSNVWVNGSPVLDETSTSAEEIAEFPALGSFTLEVTDLVHEGRNRIAVRVDHRTLRELSLGGIVGPVYLLESGG